VAAGALLADEPSSICHKMPAGIVVGIDTPAFHPYSATGIKQVYHFLPIVQVLGPSIQSRSHRQTQAWSGLIKAMPMRSPTGVGDTDNASLARISKLRMGNMFNRAFDLNEVAPAVQVAQTMLCRSEHFLKVLGMRCSLNTLFTARLSSGLVEPRRTCGTEQCANNYRSSEEPGHERRVLPAIVAKEFADPAAQIKPYDRLIRNHTRFLLYLPSFIVQDSVLR